MAVRPKVHINNLPWPETAGGNVTAFYPVIHSADYTVVNATAGQNAMGIAMNSAVSGGDVSVWGPGNIVECIVGTGGATRDTWAVVVADGMATQAMSSGTTVRYCLGIWQETATAGQRAALLICPNVVFTA